MKVVGLSGQRERELLHCHVAAVKVSAETRGLGRPLEFSCLVTRGLTRLLRPPIPLSGQ